MQFPPGTVGVLCTDLARYNWFTQSLVALQGPPGSQTVFCSGLWISTAVNKLVGAMGPQVEFLMLMPDDHIFEPDLLRRLLSHNVPLVAPLCCLRRPPFAPS